MTHCNESKKNNYRLVFEKNFSYKEGVHRKLLLSLLKTYGGDFPRKHALVKRFSDFVSTHPDCFEPSLKLGHVTGSAWLLDHSLKNLLLTHHKKLNKWLQLGGHADGESDIQSVARREAIEESGLEDISKLSDNIFDIDIHLIPQRDLEPAHYHYDVCFLFKTERPELIKVSSESHNLAWVSVDELPRYSNEASILRMAKKWRNMISQF